MDGQRVTGRCGRGLLWCTLGAMLALNPDTASADQCTGIGTPCEYQLQSAVTYNGLQSQTPLYFCTTGTIFDEGEAA